jgi:hypothetical protein
MCGVRERNKRKRKREKEIGEAIYNISLRQVDLRVGEKHINRWNNDQENEEDTPSFNSDFEV